RAIRLHPARQLADLPEWWPAIDCLQCSGLVTLEARQRRLAGGAVHPQIGDLAHPPLQMGLECRPADKGMAGNGVALDVTDAALVLALGARPIRRAGPRPEAPVIGKSVQPLVETHLAGGRIVVIDQRPRVVKQHLLRHPAKAPEGTLHAVEPS